jgi:hypothetical protein
MTVREDREAIGEIYQVREMEAKETSRIGRDNRNLSCGIQEMESIN